MHYKVYGTSINGNTVTSLPSTWHELLIQVTYTNNDATNILISHFAYGMMIANNQYVSLGNYGTSYAVGKLSKTSFQLTSLNWAGSDQTANAKTYIYYR